MLSELVPIFAILCVFGLPIGGFIVLRVLQHQERMAMINRGIDPGAPRGWKGQQGWTPPPPPPFAQGNDPYAWQRVQNSAQYQLRRGIMTAFIGAALFIGLSFIGYNDGEWRPGPWLLGGLIPLFVGAAQIVSAVLAGAEIPGRRTMSPGGTMPPPPQPPPPGPPGASGAYTYRPSGNQEELPQTKPPRPT